MSILNGKSRASQQFTQSINGSSYTTAWIPCIKYCNGNRRFFLLRIGDVGIEPNRLQAPGIDGKSVKGPLIEADVWIHLAVTYDADAKTCIVYVNGEEFVRNEIHKQE